MDRLIGILNAQGQLEGVLNAETQLKGALNVTTLSINGKTPIKGVDYFTEQDIAEIKEYIQMQVGGGVVGRDSYLEFPNVGSEQVVYLDKTTHKYYFWSNDPMGYFVAGSDYLDIKVIDGGNANGYYA